MQDGVEEKSVFKKCILGYKPAKGSKLIIVFNFKKKRSNATIQGIMPRLGGLKLMIFCLFFLLT